MARRSKMITLTGPWLGVEERESYQTPKHCSIALNCDFTRGNIEARKGFKRIHQSSNPGALFTHLVKKNGKPKYIIAAGPQVGASNINFFVYDMNGTRVDQDDQKISEPHDLNWRCSFVDVIIPARDSETGLRTKPHRCTLIVTPYSTYIYDVDANPAVIREATADDAFRGDDVNIAYWANMPRGPIAVAHQGRVAYAGFKDGSHVQLTAIIEDNEDFINSDSLDLITRKSYTMGPQWFVLSDPFDPLGIRSNYIFRVGDRESITGLYSFMEQLIVFTDESIYTLMGSGLDPVGKPNFVFRKLVSNVGCISQDSIVEVGGALYFIALDGIYAFQGMGPEGGVTKISKCIDSIFSGRRASSHIHSEISDELSQLGYPFVLNIHDMRFSHGIHIHSRNEIWWTASVVSHPSMDFAVTIIYDYGNQAFGYYIKQNTVTSKHAPGIFSGAAFRQGSHERILVFNNQAQIFEYGSGDDDGTGIPMYYVSGRLMKDQDGVSLLRPVRLKMLSKGKTLTRPDPPRWFLDGEEAHRDGEIEGVAQASADRQASSGTLDCHPDTANSYFWGASTWATGVWTAVDWFSQKIEVDTVRSRSFRLGVSDDPKSNQRGSLVVINSITIDLHGEDPR